MSEMVERVARAICREDEHDPDGDDCWNFGRDHSIQKKNWEAYVKAARAAIEAMRDADIPFPEAIKEYWRAVIDEALK